MKRALPGLLLALMTADETSTVFAQAAQAPATAASPEESAVRRANTEEVDAFLNNDPKALERLWSESFVVTNPLNMLVTKEETLRVVRAGVLAMRPYTRQIDYLRVYGDTAITAGRETVVWGPKTPNAGKTEHQRFTGIWMKQRGHWQEVARHSNLVTP